MRAKRAAALTVTVLITLTIFYALPTSLAQNTSLSYKLLNQADDTVSYTLNVVVPQTLNKYYQELDHRSYVDKDFPKFVTPYTVKPIADALRQIYPEDEDFANGVLTLVHQIPYEATDEQYYPVETMLRNYGDCDMFSLLAASIMKAGGLKITLLHYGSQEHMNIGVHLDNLPQDGRSDIYSLQSGGLTYYIAECTSSNWIDGWRVGECPEDLRRATMTVITVENSEQISPGQVSASFKKLEATTLTVDVSSFVSTEGSTITLHGQILPAVSDQNVTLYHRVNGGDWSVLSSAVTRENGEFTYAWNTEAIGIVDLRASWTGNDLYAGTISEAKNALILPLYLLALLAVPVMALIRYVADFVVRHKKNRNQKPSENTSYTYEI
jgi:hypothetical protein